MSAVTARWTSEDAVGRFLYGSVLTFAGIIACQFAAMQAILGVAEARRKRQEQAARGRICPSTVTRSCPFRCYGLRQPGTGPAARAGMRGAARAAFRASTRAGRSGRRLPGRSWSGRQQHRAPYRRPPRPARAARPAADETIRGHRRPRSVGLCLFMANLLDALIDARNQLIYGIFYFQAV